MGNIISNDLTFFFSNSSRQLRPNPKKYYIKVLISQQGGQCFSQFSNKKNSVLLEYTFNTIIILYCYPLFYFLYKKVTCFSQRLIVHRS